MENFCDYTVTFIGGEEIITKVYDLMINPDNNPSDDLLNILTKGEHYSCRFFLDEIMNAEHYEYNRGDHALSFNAVSRSEPALDVFETIASYHNLRISIFYEDVYQDTVGEAFIDNNEVQSNRSFHVKGRAKYYYEIGDYEVFNSIVFLDLKKIESYEGKMEYINNKLNFIEPSDRDLLFNNFILN